MELIKEIKGICSKILSVGKPADEDVLYSEVIKREIPKESAEELTFREIKETITHLFKNNSTTSAKSVTEFSRGTPTPKSIKAAPAKKTTRKKPAAKKTATTKKSATQKPETKQTEEKKTTPAKKPAAKKKAAPKGSKRDEKIALYIKDIKKHYGEVDEAFVAIVVKNLGPSIYRKDAELVSCSSPKELDTVRKNFLMKKLGIEASQGVLDAAIADVCQELKSARKKYRATFYYALAKKFKKESVLS